MVKKFSLRDVDFATLRGDLADQFRGLNPNDPSAWPSLPRYALCAAVAIAVLIALWFAWLTGVTDEFEAARAKETGLRADYVKKLSQAANHELLKKQREQVQQYVTLLERQLPSKAEMDALLSDINQAGLGRNLQFELFRPGQVVVKDYYAELPIALKVTGSYHDIGAFTADIANLSRIVTLNNLSVTPQKDGALTMDATAKTFRYLDLGEQEAQQKAKADAKGKKK